MDINNRTLLDMPKIFKTLVNLSKRIKRKSLNAGFNNVTAGRIDSKSIIAIVENG